MGRCVGISVSSKRGRGRDVAFWAERKRRTRPQTGVAWSSVACAVVCRVVVVLKRYRRWLQRSMGFHLASWAVMSRAACHRLGLLRDWHDEAGVGASWIASVLGRVQVVVVGQHRMASALVLPFVELCMRSRGIRMSRGGGRRLCVAAGCIGGIDGGARCAGGLRSGLDALLELELVGRMLRGDG